MATLAEILPRKFPGNGWRLRGDDYATLEWMAGNPDPKPSEATIRGFSAEIDTALAQEARARRQAEALFDSADALVKAIDILADFQAQVASKLKGTALNTPLDTTRLAALRAKIDAVKATL